jgi:uncharacterized protein (TIGR00730 family)
MALEEVCVDKHDAAPICENRDTYEAVERSIEHLWSIINELSQIAPPTKNYFRVTIFGSARVRPGQPLYEDVKRLASALSSSGCDIVTGGGPGLMQAANEGERLGDGENKTRSYGLPIHLPFEDGANPFVEKSFKHRTFFTRLHHFVQLSSAFVVVGGGVGTTLEALLVWQLLQVGHLKDTPLIFVGQMWKGLITWAEENMLSHDPALVSPKDLRIPTCVDTVDEAIEILTACKTAYDAR